MRAPAKALLTLAATLVAGPGLAAPSGPAAGAVAAYLKGTRIPCEGRPRPSCTIASIQEDVTVFYGRPDPSTEEAVAFVTYQGDATGNAMDQMAIVFRKAGASWNVVGRADNTIGSSPRQVRFQPGAVTYVGTVMGPGDSRANPTGSKSFRLAVGDRSVRFEGR